MVLHNITVALAGLIFLLPLHAMEAGDTEAITDAAGQQAAGNNPEQPVVERRDVARQGIHEAGAPVDIPVDPGVSQRNEALDQRYTAARSKHQQRIEAARQQQQALAAQAEKRRVEKLDRYLKQREDRQREIEQRHEAMRNRAEEEHNYLVQHHEEMLERELQSKIDIANRYEDLRKSAAQRRKKIAAFRAAMKDMTAEERRDYMDKHRAELFGPGNRANRNAGIHVPDQRGAGRPPPGFSPSTVREMPQE